MITENLTQQEIFRILTETPIHFQFFLAESSPVDTLPNRVPLLPSYFSDLGIVIYSLEKNIQKPNKNYDEDFRSVNGT